jgi:glycosyltransferase involved in cell wall biosynthesis
MKVVVWQCRPNYHDLGMYKALARSGMEVSFVFDIDSDIRGAVDTASDLKGYEARLFSYFNVFSFLRLARSADINIVVGGLAFKSTTIAHIFASRQRKIFVSEGRYPSPLFKHMIRDFFEAILCRSEQYICIGENANLYFRKIFGTKAKLVDFAYYYLLEKQGEVALFSIQDAPITPTRHIGFIGRGCHGKGIDIFFDCAESLPDKNFVFIGALDSEYVERSSRIPNLMAISWLPPEQVLLWLSKIEILVVPSRVEPYGCVVQEGVVAGCKVLCSKFAGARFLKKNFPEQVWVSNTNDASEYQDEILASFHQFTSNRSRPDLQRMFSVEYGAKQLTGVIFDQSRSI